MDLLQQGRTKLKSRESASLVYHDLFDYPLTYTEIIKWTVGKKYPLPKQKVRYQVVDGYYFLRERTGLVYERTKRSRNTDKKLYLANHAAKILSKIPGVEMVALTGSLAMKNAQKDSDIDLLIVCSQKTLWCSRFLGFVVFKLLGKKIRRYGKQEEENQICTNIWLEEKYLSWTWQDRNVFTAHEIAQIQPLYNKNNTYEKFILKNSWILDYWPNSVKTRQFKNKFKEKKPNQGLFVLMTLGLMHLFEPFAYKIQLNYMKHKITREVVTPHRAEFHPVKLSKVVISKLTSSP